MANEENLKLKKEIETNKKNELFKNRLQMQNEKNKSIINDLKNIIEKKEVENITIKQKHEKYAKDLENKLKNDNEKLYFEQEKVKHVLKELENYKKNESNNAHQNYKHIEVLNNEIKKIVDERNKVFEQMNIIVKSKDL